MARDHTWRKGQRRFAALLGACLLAAAVAARRAGLPDPLCGLLLAVSFAGVLSWLAATLVRRSGLGVPEAAAWFLGLVVASAGPVLASVSPGERLAAGSVTSPGDSVGLTEDRSERVLLLLSAQVPEPGQVAFDLRAGGELVSGVLFRGTRRWSVGDERGHSHLDRASLLIPADVPAGRVQFVLERSSAPDLALALAVYRERFPPWLPAVAALCALIGFAWRAAPLRGGREAAMAASAAILTGLAAGAAATPAHAMGAVLRGLLLGLLGGLPLGAMLALALSWLRRGPGGGHAGRHRVQA